MFCGEPICIYKTVIFIQILDMSLKCVGGCRNYLQNFIQKGHLNNEMVYAYGYDQ